MFLHVWGVSKIKTEAIACHKNVPAKTAFPSIVACTGYSAWLLWLSRFAIVEPVWYGWAGLVRLSRFGTVELRSCYILQSDSFWVDCTIKHHDWKVTGHVKITCYKGCVCCACNYIISIIITSSTLHHHYVIIICHVSILNFFSLSF